MIETELAWAAGFFDGEGHAHTHYIGTHLRVQIAVSQVEREPLDRFQRAVGTGKVYGPYPNRRKSRPNGRPIHQWSAYGPKARSAMRLLWPYLSTPKKCQYLKALRP